MFITIDELKDKSVSSILASEKDKELSIYTSILSDYSTVVSYRVTKDNIVLLRTLELKDAITTYNKL